MHIAIVRFTRLAFTRCWISLSVICFHRLHEFLNTLLARDFVAKKILRTCNVEYVFVQEYFARKYWAKTMSRNVVGALSNLFPTLSLWCLGFLATRRLRCVTVIYVVRNMN